MAASKLVLPPQYNQPDNSAIREKTLKVVLSSIHEAEQAAFEFIKIQQAAKQMGCISITFDIEKSLSQPIQAILGTRFSMKTRYRYTDDPADMMFYQLFTGGAMPKPTAQEAVLTPPAPFPAPVKRKGGRPRKVPPVDAPIEAPAASA